MWNDRWKDPAFNLTLDELKKTMDPGYKYTGRASVQVDQYLTKVIRPLLGKRTKVFLA